MATHLKDMQLTLPNLHHPLADMVPLVQSYVWPRIVQQLPIKLHREAGRGQGSVCVPRARLPATSGGKACIPAEPERSSTQPILDAEEEPSEK